MRENMQWIKRALAQKSSDDIYWAQVSRKPLFFSLLFIFD